MKEFAHEFERNEDGAILFPRDVEWRKSIYPAEAITHPAKMQMHIVQCAVDYFHEQGVLPKGGHVLDPFGGTGTTALASLSGYRVTLIELEDIFKEMLVATRRLWRENKACEIEPVFYFGDCRHILPQIPEKSVDLIITSPPYSVTAQVGKEVTEFTGVLAQRKAQMRRYGSSEASTSNIGRFNPFMFNTAMLKVYQECLRVLKPGGVYVSVTKDRMLAGKRQSLKLDVMKTAAEAGFRYTGEWWRWKAPGGLMQNIMKSKGAEVVETEDIICFNRPSE